MKRLKMIFFFLSLLLIWNSSIATAQFLEAGVRKLENPESAPDFTLKDLKGQKISLKELRG
ncbi:MAG TPA: hypothetical protein VLZ10_04950 [Thermodesulfobacteriota bacterium]|nr:hypothetical protein [Thermodesulfobacteriota bacterium]